MAEKNMCFYRRNIKCLEIHTKLQSLFENRKRVSIKVSMQESKAADEAEN
jgi:hypothetical protein